MDKQGAIALINELSDLFVGREEESKVSVLALVTKQHCVFIGEPGTAKSALLSTLARAVNGNYFQYLLTKYTIPSELVGEFDPVTFQKAGKLQRDVNGMLPTANIAFVDEIYKANSETLNALLNITNERVFMDTGNRKIPVPLYSMFAASNELPQSDDLQAFHDRLFFKHFVKPMNKDRIEEAIVKTVSNPHPAIRAKYTLKDIDELNQKIWDYLRQNVNDVARNVATVVKLLKKEGVTISDRTAVGARFFPFVTAAYGYIFDQPDFKKAAIAVSKYILHDFEDQKDAYERALDTMIPPELRAAQEALDKAHEARKAGDFKTAREEALSAVQKLKEIVGKDSDKEKFDMFRSEIKEVGERATRLVNAINKATSDLESEITA